MRALVSLVTRCTRLTRRTASALAQLRYHTSQLPLGPASSLPPLELLDAIRPPPPRYAVIGLGNPGPLFTNTRHNVGAMCVQYMADAYRVSLDAHKPTHLCQLAQTVRPLPLTLTRDHPPDSPAPLSSPRHLLLAQPTTYMNHSGQAVRALLTAYYIQIRHCILLYDDVHLPLGTLRITTRGNNAAGHNGLAHVLQQLQAAAGRAGQGLVRVRVGVGREGGVESGGMAEFVLGRFEREEMAVLESEVFAKVWRAVEGIAAGEVARMMNAYNGKASRNADDETDRSEAPKRGKRQMHDDAAAT